MRSIAQQSLLYSLGCLVALACSSDPKPASETDGGGRDGAPTDALTTDLAETDGGDGDSTAPRDSGIDSVVTDAGVDSAPHGDASQLLAELRDVIEGNFATSKGCAICHANKSGAQAMRDEKDRPVAPYDLWRAAPMANAGRDPIWRAVVAAEVESTPSKKVAIEQTCMRCHAPMAYTQAQKNNEAPVAMDLLTQDTNRSQLALDGVACALCHQIKEDQLGTPASFSGHYVINDSKHVYGPHDNLFASPMIGTSGFDAITSTHIRNANLCGSCHTLFVQPLKADGTNASTELFPEQTPYLEWRNSIYSTEAQSPDAAAKTCQNCHMPATSADGVAIETQVATRPDGSDYPDFVVVPRKPYARHLFVGANTLLPTLLDRFRDELSPNASSAAFTAYIAEVRKLLAEQTATLSIEGVQRNGDQLSFAVKVESLTGHKLPTAYPARRVVLVVRVSKADGTPLWQSGVFDSAGTLLLANGSVQPFEKRGGPIEPHHQSIDQQDQVQIYQGILADANGAPTFHLLRSTQYAKDNRLLPKGWSNGHSDIASISPVGVTGDNDFVGGSDTVAYHVTLPTGTNGTLRVEASLWHQPFSPRFMSELGASQTAEVAILQRMISQTGLPPEEITSATTQTP